MAPPAQRQYDPDPEVRFAHQFKTLDAFVSRWRELQQVHPDANEKALLAQSIFDGARRLGEELILCEIRQNAWFGAPFFTQVSDLWKHAKRLHEELNSEREAHSAAIAELNAEIGRLRGNKGR